MESLPYTGDARNPAHQQLRHFIDDGGYAPGDRLPAERELMGSLGISRTTLRKGLEVLERDGTIWRHVGKGTFVSDPAEVATPAPDLAKLSQAISPVQMMRARLSLEPALAREAAANASSEAVEQLRVARDRASTATTWDTYESNDDAFHRAVAMATGNGLLLSLYDHLHQVQRAVTWRKVIRASAAPPADHPSFAEHDAILAGIEARDPVAAHASMRAHLNSVSNRLYGED